MLNLMIVDDEPIILKGLMKIIEKGNTPCSEIVSASDGYDALEKLENFQPDLLITDIQMPEMNGLELIKEVQYRGLCKRFLILTGYDDTTYLRQAIRHRVIDYLLKPINKTELLDVLANVSVELVRIKEDSATQDLPVDNAQSSLESVEHDRISKNVRKIIQYINKHYTKDLSLNHIAEQVYLHPNYISSLFKKETGLTFIHYLHLYRIKKAKELMVRDSEMSFQRIAEQVGYENVRHFFNVFKKYCGVTPGEYRYVFNKPH